MKKAVSLALAVAVLLSSIILCCSAFADDVEWNFDKSTSTLTISGSGAMEDYESITDVPWYSELLQIKKIIVEEGVTSIGNYSFSGAKNVTDVSLPDSLTTVGASAFSSCSSLTQLTLGANVTSIADTSFAFDGLEQKENFAIVTTAGSYALCYAVDNSINFVCNPVTCGTYTVNINAENMKAYYPYTAKVDGTFKIYSTGNHDTLGWVLDKNFKTVRYDDDSGDSTNFSMTVELTKGSTYYIRARILNSKILDSFSLVIEPVEYSVDVTVTAMLNPLGESSDIVLDNATINGEVTNGTMTVTVSDNSELLVACDGVERVYELSADYGDKINIPLMMCDLNGDGWVNAKDYSIMRKTGSKYLSIYENFINFHLT